MKKTLLFVFACAAVCIMPLYGQNPESAINGHEWVDLGLPSGILWATCNIGAETPEDYGDFFAWGETTPNKDKYDWSNYKYCKGSDKTLTKYCCKSKLGKMGSIDNLTLLLPEDDAATTNWGEGWRIPTEEDFEELYNNTTVTWTTQNGVNGVLLTASNGNSLFLPAAGYRHEIDYEDEKVQGYYWSSSLFTVASYGVYFLKVDSDGCAVRRIIRSVGCSIRPVASSH
jgi:hypothetical protein